MPIMKRRSLIRTGLLFVGFSLLPHSWLGRQKDTQKRPKLIVLIVIDQFRYDYLARFAPHFSADGFNACSSFDQTVIQTIAALPYHPIDGTPWPELRTERLSPLPPPRRHTP